MNITIISGSNRPNAESLRVAKYITESLKVLNHDVNTDLIDLHASPLPLFDDSGSYLQDENISLIAEKLAQSDGFVMVTPEWSGMASIALKNMFLHYGNHEFGHKPAMIVAVSSGFGGAFPVSDLRASSYKNTHICYIPEHVILRTVNSLILDHKSTVEKSPTENFLINRINYSLNILIEYTKGLKLVRESGKIDLVHFSNGMS